MTAVCLFLFLQVFDDAKPIITSCVDGYNVCIIAYGQTGAGKTYTMMGPREKPGVNIRSLQDLFSIIKERTRIQYSMRVCRHVKEHVAEPFE